MVHAAHHIFHAQPFDRIVFRQRCTHACGGGQRTGSIAGAIHGLSEQGAGVLTRRDQYIVGFTRAEAEFMYFDWLNWLAVSRHHSQGLTGNAHIVEGVAGTVNKAQLHGLAAFKQPGPVTGRCRAIEQIGHHCG